MKSLSGLVMLLAVVMGITSCSSSNALKAGNEKIKINGNWMVDKVDYSGADGKLKITSFDDVAASCFEGSTWNFIANGNGSYTINSSAAGCTGGQRSIFWSTAVENGTNIFQFKNIGANKAKTVTDGYKLEVVSSSATELSMRSPVLFEGKTIYINYHFVKS